MTHMRIMLLSTVACLALGTPLCAQVKVPSTTLVKPITPITAVADPRPVVTSLRINANAALTSDRTVVLDHVLGSNTTGLTQYRVSEKPDLSDASWLPYNPRPNYSLSVGNGDKIVYFQVRKPALKTTSLNGGFDTSTAVSDVITFANPRLVGVTLEGGAGFSHDRTIDVAVDYEGNANLYRISERSDFSDAQWQSLNGRRTFTHTLPDVPGQKTLFVQIANGSDYISDRIGKAVNYVRARVHEVPLDLAINTARARGYTVSATSARNEWRCEIFSDPTTGWTEFRATPKIFPGYAGQDTCTFRLFEGRQLRAPWTIESFAYVPGTLPDPNERVTNTPDPRGGKDLGMTVVWQIPATGLIPEAFHRSFFEPLKLNGPENGNWQDAF